MKTNLSLLSNIMRLNSARVTRHRRPGEVEARPNLAVNLDGSRAQSKHIYIYIDV